MKPPQHAADEKAAIQALDRFDPVLPLSPGKPMGGTNGAVARSIA